MTWFIKAVTFDRILTLIFLVLALTGVSGLSLWNLSAPILTYDTSNASSDWGPGVITSHIDVRLRNQGWQTATSYEAEVKVSGYVMRCFVREGQNSFNGSLRYCDSVFPNGYQPCQAQMMILWNNGTNTILVTSSSFPAGCDFTLSIDSGGMFPFASVSGKSDQVLISKSISAQQQINQRDWTLWTLEACVLLFVCLAIVRGVVYHRLGKSNKRRGKHPVLTRRRVLSFFPYIVVCLAVGASIVWYVRMRAINSFSQSIYNLTMQQPDLPIGPPFVYSTLFADYYCGGLDQCMAQPPLGALGCLLDVLLILSLVIWAVLVYRQNH